MLIVKTTVSLEDGFCPMLDFEDQKEDIKALAQKFGLKATPKYLELTVSPWLQNKLAKTLALMEEHGLTEVTFFSTNRDEEEEAAASTIALYDEDNNKLTAPSYHFCEGFAPKEAYRSNLFEISVINPYNRRVSVHLNVSNSYSETTLSAHFRPSELGFPSKKFVPKTVE